ncbi:MAG: hypothetical protein M1825_002045 [Sarcosagium campestre]|nr:MAG: hypothetical protein M1825_002045 [Sarcosagium campestre]
MSIKERQYELVLFGATGYTGTLTAEYITTHSPTNLKWALAGRSASKLARLKGKLEGMNSDRLEPEIEIAALNQVELHDLAKKTKLIINTVGPYALYGEAVVEACASNGTHYLDVTGEAPWVLEMIEKYNEKAKANGAIVRANKYGLKAIRAASRPWALSPVPGPRYAKPTGRLGVRVIPELGTLTTSITGGVNRAMVHRSWGLLGSGHIYGPKFHFSEYMKVRNTLLGIIVHFAIGIGLLALAFPPVRWLLRKVIYAPGTGPTKKQTSKELLEFRAVAIADQDVSSPGRAYARVRYEGGMYYLTGILVTEAAMVILRGPDDIVARKLGGGLLTPATLGQPFIDGLAKASFGIETKLL